jgi:hypothetical protein
MKNYNIYQEKAQNTLSAKNWLKLSDAKDSQSGGNFSLSIAHSNFMLMRCGQHSTGGKNYHESPKMFNEAMLHVIVKNYETLTKEALAYLIAEEKEALKMCKSEIEKISEQIKEAETYDN